MDNKRDFWLKTGIIGLGVVIIAALLLFNMAQPEEPVARSYEDHVWLRKESVSVTATGSAGAASGSANTDRDLHGYIYAVHLDFTAGISNTTDITLTQASPSLTILQLTDYYTDTWYYPVVEQDDSAGSGTSTYEKALVQDAVDIGVGQTTSGTVGTVTIYWGQ
jgi:hypothetical protein